MHPASSRGTPVPAEDAERPVVAFGVPDAEVVGAVLGIVQAYVDVVSGRHHPPVEYVRVVTRHLRTQGAGCPGAGPSPGRTLPSIMPPTRAQASSACST